MARIVIDARIISSSTGRYLERLLTYLEEIDTSNEYIVLVHKKDIRYWRSSNKNFTLQVADFANYSLGEQFGLARLLYSLKPDLVHFAMPQHPVLYRGNVVTTVHDLILLRVYNSDKNWLAYKAKQFVGRFVFRRIMKASKYLITPSEYTKKDVQQYYRLPAKKIVVTPLAADTKTSVATKYPLPYKKYLLYVGQQSDYKNVRGLIKAHQSLLKIHPDLGLVLVGAKNASAQTNEKWVKKNKYKNVLFTGFVDDSELLWLYQHTVAYVFPSLMEGFGLPGLEAMTQGAPVVSSNATCLPEVYGDAAHYFNPKDVEDMAQKINEVLEDKVLRDKLIKNGKEQVKKYSWRKTAEQTLEVYKKALESNKDS